MIGGGIMFVVGGLLWGIPMLIASGGLNAYLAALGTQAGEDFAGGEMLYLNPTPRGAGVRSACGRSCFPGTQRALAAAVLALAAVGLDAAVDA